VNKIRVLVVDDSAFLRRNLPRILESDPGIEVVDTAGNGAEGLQKVMDLRPDVVMLDLVMPMMDGLTALRQLMRKAPTPVVVVSAATHEGARETLEALSLGAVDFVTKPSGPVSLDIDTVRAELIGKVKAAYASKVRGTADTRTTCARFQAIIERSRDQGRAPERPARGSARQGRTPHEPGRNGDKRLVAIVASTGGPVALQHVLSRLPGNLDAGLVIVLHIAPGFTRPFADRLNELSPLAVREAEDGMPIAPGVALIAPAGVHLTVARPLTRTGAGPVLPAPSQSPACPAYPEYSQGEQSEGTTEGGPVEGHVLRTVEGLVARLCSEPADALHHPSADVLFDSIARCCAAETCAVILTGMGNDGALGLRAIRQGGGYTVAQDEATSVVYGMPRRAVELGGVEISLPLDQIADEIVRVTSKTFPKALSSYQLL
jgi:two-component system chemotaxis response regulator CheB